MRTGTLRNDIRSYSRQGRSHARADGAIDARGVAGAPLGRRVLALAVLAALPGAAHPQQQEVLADYFVVDNVEGEFVHSNPVPIRPMAVTPDLAELYTLNTHADTVVHFFALDSIQSEHFPVPRGPVSIALWQSVDAEPAQDCILVVCRESSCLALLDRMTGRVIRLLGLPAEPSDILVDGNVAFVSCAATDEVVEIDLLEPGIVAHYPLPAKNPVFMAFDPDRNVLVAPMLSGNNSGPRKDPIQDLNAPPASISDVTAGPGVVDFGLEALNGPGLPDHDLFRIDRATGSVAPVARGVGTVLFALGYNPVVQQVWQLNTEANNKDPQRQGEAAIQGEIVFNRLTRFPLVAPGADPVEPGDGDIIDLDRFSSADGATYDPALSVGQPYALEIDPVTGWGMVLGLLTDNAILINEKAEFQLEWDLQPGDIPRAGFYHPVFGAVFIYCWGSNKIRSYFVDPKMTPWLSLDLGFDPTPEIVKEGREIFYDAAHSEHNNASCASCHIEGRTDMAVWNLSNLPTDDKGVMVTQTLEGIDKMIPFHWRAEQRNNLRDFNAAFVNLLGASEELSSDDFDKFEAFVFSLQNPANPFQHRERKVSNLLQPPLPAGSPFSDGVAGQLLYHDAAKGCESCHNLPAGTHNDVVADGAVFGDQNTKRQHFKTAGFQAMFRKEQDVDVETPGIQTLQIELAALDPSLPNELYNVPLLGAGLSHGGVADNLSHFVTVFALTQKERANVVSFIHQWDQGLAPATRACARLGGGATDTTDAEWLHAQALAGHCDVAAFGHVTEGGTQHELRWYLDVHATPPVFRPETSAFGTRDLGYFATQAAQGDGDNVFVGLPRGMGERFAVDYDGDGLYNGDEAGWSANPFDADTDGDDWLDGHEVANGGDPADDTEISDDQTDPTILRATTQFVTSRVARINVEADEDVTVKIEYRSGAGEVSVKESTRPARTHSLLLTDLLPSTLSGDGGTVGAPFFTYTGSVFVKDLGGREVSTDLPTMPAFNLGLPSAPPPPITTRPFRVPGTSVVIGELEWEQLSQSGSGVRGTARVRVDRATGGPPALPAQAYGVVTRLFRNGEQLSDFVAGPLSVRLEGFYFERAVAGGAVVAEPFTGFDGPFLSSLLTDANGEARLDFQIPGASLDDDIVLNVEVVGQLSTEPDFPFPTLQRNFDWVMPQTLAPNRSLAAEVE